MVFFDSNTVADADKFEVLPAGSYPLVISKVEMRTTKKGDGRYCSVEFVVGSGPGKGRKVFDMFNIENPNPTCVNIGRAMFKKLVCAAGVPVIQSEDHLLTLTDKIVVGDVVAERGQDGETRNKVKTYHPYGTSTQQRPVSAPPMANPEPKSTNPIDCIPF